MNNDELGWLMCHLAGTLMSFGLDLARYACGDADESDIAPMTEKFDGVMELLERFKNRAKGRRA